MAHFLFASVFKRSGRRFVNSILSDTNMDPGALEKTLNLMVVKLLKTARDITWNTISDNCKFILSEIKNTDESYFEQMKTKRIQNDQKIITDLQNLIPELLILYDGIYDINLYIDKVSKNLTSIDIRYYSKFSLDEEYQLKVKDREPMFHCKANRPPYLLEKNEKFDINWENKPFKMKWKLFWIRQKRRIIGHY